MDGDPVAPTPPELSPGHVVEIDAEAATQAVHRPDGRTVSQLVFHVRRLVGLERRRRTADSPLQLALF